MTLQLTRKHNFDLIFDSQKVYRLILEAMSSPGGIVNIQDYADKLYGDYPVLLAVAMTLLDNEVSFCTCDNNSLTDEIASLTLAGRESVEAADFIFVSDLGYMEYAIENAKCGTLSDPHKSATIIILNEIEPTHRLKLHGPGIVGQAEVMLTQAAKDAVTIRDAQNYEYPQGIDLLFVSGAGELSAIPRLTRIEVV